MTQPSPTQFCAIDLEAIQALTGHIAILVTPEGGMDGAGRRVNRLCKGAVARVLSSAAWEKLSDGDVITLAYPAGMAADAVHLLKLARRVTPREARRAGAKLRVAAGKAAVHLYAGNFTRSADLALGVVLRGYEFGDHKSKAPDLYGPITVYGSKPDEIAAKAAPLLAVAEGVFFTRDLVNAPANVLTTTRFAEHLSDLGAMGVKVEVLDEPELEKLGMRALLGVGQGSESPSKVVVMEWQGAADAQPFALVGKGVVFDTGGISLKPAAGMEDMTMDMGGAGVVAGVMKALALRKARANVVGLVGLVENMPDGRAQRPGDVVVSMKGDTIEVINTDAEGRLVLADVLWYAQERFAPRAMINLATLTGAIIIGLGHDNAGVFANDEALCNAFLKAARGEDEGAWPMPLDDSYDALIKSRIADIKNTGGRPAGSITAAKFLQRFVKKETPWIHLDIAGVASIPKDSTYAPAGATGWGVLALDRLIQDMFDEG
ncbi:leucyl aminopeptidase [Rhodobacteraceae bacterium XHP0102]|nr:leucyl aminopeptidase [Rhodobacteraceae bacterium XHP0102]